MRVVVDTNIFVSAALKSASWPAIIVRAIDRNGGLLKSEATEDELFRVLQRPKFAAKLTPGFVANIRRIYAAAELVVISEPVRACRDAKDDKVLELALNGRADVIVSGDADLLVMGRFRGIPILDAAIFGRSLIG